MAPRKHVTLCLEQKVEIIKSIENGQNYGMIAEKYGIGKSTVGDIKKNKEKIRNFFSTTERGLGTRKTLKQPENLVLENALFIWFMQQRRLHIPISGEIICERARSFHREITKQEDGFTASRGWLDNFKRRHGIKRLKITGEKLSCDEASIEPFRNELQRVINENNLDPDEDLANHEILTDDQILRIVAKENDIDDEDESDSIITSKVSPSEAVNALNTVLQWSEDQNMDSTDILFVRRLRERAFEMKIQSITQKKITDCYT